MSRLDVLCPRCYADYYLPEGAPYEEGGPLPPALSRVEPIYICSACGQDEALRDHFGLPPVPPDEWPVSGRYGLPA